MATKMNQNFSELQQVDVEEASQTRGGAEATIERTIERVDKHIQKQKGLAEPLEEY